MADGSAPAGKRPLPKRIGSENGLKILFFWLSGEWLLGGRNGGGRILLRTSLLSGTVFGFALWFHSFINPDASWIPDATELRRELYINLPWFGALFAGVYAALYTRFASQWQYLSGVYNNIKAAECDSCRCEGVRACPSREALIEWKAAFIEDCLALHVAGRRVFATTIWFWGHDPEVQTAFADSHGPDCLRQVLGRLEFGGSLEFRAIRAAVRNA
ncbi:MAG: hypothetical protein ACOY0T_27225 [Myxococcota bacterium]